MRKGHRGNFLDDFQGWMIRKGKKPKKREIPSEPMSPIGAAGKLRLLRRILVDLKYVKAIKTDSKNKANGIQYKVWPSGGVKRIDDIMPEDFVQWIDKQFPSCRDRKEKQRKSAYVMAAWKFGEYLVYEKKDHNNKPIWNGEQLLRLKEEIYPPAVEKFEVEILDLDKIDGLIEFIESQNYSHYAMAYLSRWLGGMRYQEVINAHKDLKTGTMQINFKNDQVTILGKGRGGLQKPRYPTLLPEVKAVLKKYLKHREKLIKRLMNRKDNPLKEDPGYLFLNQYGKKHSQHSTHFNNALRKHARVWGKLTEEEIALISTHRIGRHGFGTYFYPKMPEKLLMEEMGLEDPKMLHRYSNIKRKQRASMMKEASKGNGNRIEEPQPRTDRLSQLKELFSGLSKEEKMQLLAEVLG